MSARQEENELPPFNCNGYPPSNSVGRESYGKPKHKVRLREIKLDFRGYDSGGVFWGKDNKETKIFRATCEGFLWHGKSKTKKEVKENLLVLFPGIRFYR